MNVLLMALGLVGLAAGADLVVRRALAIASRLRIPTFVAGLTITSVGTSLPEISTNIAVALDVRAGLPSSGLAIGNVVGSCLSQITLLLGLVATFATLQTTPRALRRDGAMLFVSALAMFVACLDGVLSRWEGALLVFAWLLYLGWLLWAEREAPEPAAARTQGLLRDAVGLAVGLILVVFCAGLVVDHAVRIAEALGVSPGIIGLLVGLGTGLPELTVSLKAIREQAGQLSLGNLIGSNITDPLLSAGIGATIAPLAVPEMALKVDFPFWLTATFIAIALLWNHHDLNRRESAVLLALFALFVYLRVGVLPG